MWGRQDVDVYCRKYEKYNEFHRGRIAPKQGRFHPKVLDAPVDCWACDLAGPFPTSRGNVYTLTAICVFTKYMILIPIQNKTAITVARAIMHHVFLKYGAREVLTDNGTEFKNKLK